MGHKFGCRIGSGKFFNRVEIVEIPTIQDLFDDLARSTDIDNDIICIKRFAAKFDIHHIGSPVQALRRAEGFAREAMGNHKMVANGNSIHEAGS